MRKAERIISQITHDLTFTGKPELITAVEHMASLGENGSFDRIMITKDVYPVVARENDESLIAAEKAIYRAVEYCWMNGENDRLHSIIGIKLPHKPKPSQFIMYCAYYYIYGVAYHKADEQELPLLF